MNVYGFTGGDLESRLACMLNVEQLRVVIRDADRCHFDEDTERPRTIHLYLARDEVIAASWSVSRVIYRDKVSLAPAVATAAS